MLSRGVGLPMVAISTGHASPVKENENALPWKGFICYINLVMEGMHLIKIARPKRTYRCLSCGVDIGSRRRKYCSAECRQKLKWKLDTRVGLVQALNVRYATFYFSKTMIMVDMLLYGTPEIFSFFYPRTPGKKPADDFGAMANLLGNIWWEEKRRTSKRHLAAVRVLSYAERNVNGISSVKPTIVTMHSLKRRYLKQLQIDQSELLSSELMLIIKNAYRRLAKVYHPDVGGDAEAFRKLQEAYEEMLVWSEHPRFTRRRGFPDKWLYDGEKRRWLQPLGDGR